MSDPAKYRTKEEVDEVRKKRDPIDRLREELVTKGILDDAALKKIDGEVREIVVRSAEFAQQSPEPDPSELYTEVLA
jgi:pyruvate dehydrogenase E1 component alpha subunit